MVDEIADKNVISLVDGNRCGIRQHPGNRPAATEEQQNLTLLVEDLNIAPSRIRNIEISERVYRQALGTREHAPCVARLAEHFHELAAGIEHLDAAIYGVGNIDVALIVERNVGRIQQLAGGDSGAAEVAKQFTIDCENFYIVLLVVFERGVNQIDFAAVAIDSDADRT